MFQPSSIVLRLQKHNDPSHLDLHCLLIQLFLVLGLEQPKHGVSFILRTCIVKTSLFYVFAVMKCISSSITRAFNSAPAEIISLLPIVSTFYCILDKLPYFSIVVII